MIGALIKAVGRTGAGRAVTGAKQLLSKEGFASAFMQTGAGRVISGMQGGGKTGTASGKKASVIHADSVSKSSADGLRISKQTLEVLTNIDETLKKVVDTLDYQRQQDAAAAEEAASEANAPGAGATPEDGQAAESPAGPDFVKKIMKLVIGLGLIASTTIMPLIDVLKSAVKWLWDLGGSVFKWLKDKLWPILTKDIPEFFTETIPEFFTETLPNMFMEGVDFLKDKMDSIVNSISGMIGSIKSKVGDLILGLVDSPAAKFLLPDSLRTGIKSFATDMKQSGDDIVKKSQDFTDKKKQEEAKKAKEEEDKKKAAQAVVDKKKEAEAAPAAEQLPPPAPTDSNMQRAGQGAMTASGSSNTSAPNVPGASGGMASSSSSVGASGGMASSSSSVGASGGMAASGAAQPEATGGTAGAALASGSTSGGLATSKAAAPVQSGGTGGAVASASMAASAPEPVYASNPASSGGPAAHMNKGKAPSSEVNPVANVPDVFPSLGSLALLWYHNASVVV